MFDPLDDFLLDQLCQIFVDREDLVSLNRLIRINQRFYRIGSICLEQLRARKEEEEQSRSFMDIEDGLPEGLKDLYMWSLGYGLFYDGDDGADPPDQVLLWSKQQYTFRLECAGRLVLKGPITRKMLITTCDERYRGVDLGAHHFPERFQKIDVRTYVLHMGS
jgi:hypothetical protein